MMTSLNKVTAMILEHVGITLTFCLIIQTSLFGGKRVNFAIVAKMFYSPNSQT